MNGQPSELHGRPVAPCLDPATLEQLIDEIESYIKNHNANPRPFVWTAKTQDILQKVARARATLDKIASE